MLHSFSENHREILHGNGPFAHWIHANHQAPVFTLILPSPILSFPHSIGVDLPPEPEICEIISHSRRLDANLLTRACFLLMYLFFPLPNIEWSLITSCLMLMHHFSQCSTVECRTLNKRTWPPFWVGYKIPSHCVKEKQELLSEVPRQPVSLQRDLLMSGFLFVASSNSSNSTCWKCSVECNFPCERHHRNASPPSFALAKRCPPDDFSSRCLAIPEGWCLPGATCGHGCTLRARATFTRCWAYFVTEVFWE